MKYAIRYDGIYNGIGGSVAYTLKLITSLIGGLLMYWMYIPQPIVVLLTMMSIDLLFGSVEALIGNKFSAATFRRGVLKKFIAFPMLYACDLVEGPLHLNFHLESYFAYVLTVYEFISIFESYSRMGGPVPKVLMSAAAKAREYISTGMYEIQEFKQTEHVVTKTSTEGKPDSTVTVHKETTIEGKPSPIVILPSETTIERDKSKEGTYDD